MGFRTFGCIRLTDILLTVSIFQVLKYIHIRLVSCDNVLCETEVKGL